MGSEAPEAREEVQGAGSSAQLDPFQSRTTAPTTAVQDWVSGHETPTRPGW